jgi:hypothetical protein
MEEIDPKLTVRDVLGYLLAYLFWILAAALGMVAILQARSALNAMWPVVSDNRWLIRPIDRFGLLFLGLSWLVYVIFVEQHYRTAITLVRTRRVRARLGMSMRQRSAQGSRVMRMLQRLGLDILARRLVPTLIAPLILLILGLLIARLAFFLIGRGVT